MRKNPYLIEQKGIHLNHEFYVVVGKQCFTEYAKMGHQYKDTVLVTRVRIFCTTLFNNNIKVVFDPLFFSQFCCINIIFADYKQY